MPINEPPKNPSGPGTQQPGMRQPTDAEKKAANAMTQPGVPDATLDAKPLVPGDNTYAGQDRNSDPLRSNVPRDSDKVDDPEARKKLGLPPLEKTPTQIIDENNAKRRGDPGSVIGVGSTRMDDARKGVESDEQAEKEKNIGANASTSPPEGIDVDPELWAEVVRRIRRKAELSRIGTYKAQLYKAVRAGEKGGYGGLQDGDIEEFWSRTKTEMEREDDLRSQSARLHQKVRP